MKKKYIFVSNFLLMLNFVKKTDKKYKNILSLHLKLSEKKIITTTSIRLLFTRILRMYEVYFHNFFLNFFPNKNIKPLFKKTKNILKKIMKPHFK